MFKIIKADADFAWHVMWLAESYNEENKHFKALTFDLSHTQSCVNAALLNKDSGHFIYLALDTRTGLAVGGYWGICAPQIHTPDLIGYDAFSYVDNKYRKHGLGKRLVEAALTEYEARGAKFVLGGANSGVIAGAVEMYKSCGFQTLGVTLGKWL